MSIMKPNGQSGFVNSLVIPLIIACILFVGALGFGFWAFAGRQDYKNNSDKKVAAAISTAQAQTQATDAKQYAEEAKNPLKKFVGSATFGSVSVSFPKTWSSYIIQNDDTSFHGYFQPDFVPSVNATASIFALRVDIIEQPFDQVVQSYSPYVQQKVTTVTPYSPPKVKNVIGARVDGTVATNTKGAVVILPLRNVTIRVMTESTNYLNDFNNIILPNLTYNP